MFEPNAVYAPHWTVAARLVTLGRPDRREPGMVTVRDEEGREYGAFPYDLWGLSCDVREHRRIVADNAAHEAGRNLRPWRY